MVDELWVRWVYKDGDPSSPWQASRETIASAVRGNGQLFAYLEVLNTGERFYPETPKPTFSGCCLSSPHGGRCVYDAGPKPERIGAVAKRVRDWMDQTGFSRDTRANLYRLLACAEASDAFQSGSDVGGEHSIYLAWRRTVTGDSA